MFRKRNQARTLSLKSPIKFSKPIAQSHRRGQTLILRSANPRPSDVSRASPGNEFHSEPLFHDEYILPMQEHRSYEPVGHASNISHPRMESRKSAEMSRIAPESADADIDEYNLLEIRTVQSVVTFHHPGRVKLVDILPIRSRRGSSSTHSSASDNAELRLSGFYRSRSPSLRSGSSSPEAMPETPLTDMSSYSQRSAFTATFKRDTSVVYRRIDQLSPSKMLPHRDAPTTGPVQSWFSHEDKDIETETPA